MLQIPANPSHRNDAPLPLLLIASLLLLFPHPIQCGPAAISGLAPTASGTVEDADAEQLHQRHAFSALEPELAENIFNREGAAKNPLRRTTTMPLTDRIDIGHNAVATNAAAGGQQQQQRKGIVGEKLSGTISSSSSRQSPPRMPRSIPSRSEYDAINDDFVSEYDALNLDFNLDDEGAKGTAKELEVPAREFSWQQGEEKAEELFPPKEWWDGEEAEDGKEKEEAEKVPKKEEAEKVPKKEEAEKRPKKEEAEKRPTLRASKLVEVVAVKEEEGEEKNVPSRRRGSPIQQPILVVDLPQRNRIHGKRGHRARRGVRVEGVARLDGWPAGSRPFGSIDREELKIVPRLVPSWPPPSTTTPMATTTTRQGKGQKTNGTAEELARKTPPSPNGGQKKGGSGQLAKTQQQQQLPPGSKLPAKKQQQQFLSTAQEFFRDLPSGRDEPSTISDGSKRTILLANSQTNPSPQQQIVPSAQLFPSQQPEGPLPPSQQHIEGSHQVHLQPSQFRPFPAGQDPFQPVLNLGSSTSIASQTNWMPAAQHMHRPQNHGQASPAGRLLPTGFVHIATLEAPPQRDEKNQILIDGKRFWVERTVPLSQFYPPSNKPSEPEQSQGKEGKEPVEELPTLLEMPHLQEAPSPQQMAENGNPTVGVEERGGIGQNNGGGIEAGVQQQQQKQDSSPSGVNKSPPPPAASVRGSRIANSARVFSLADNEPPLWSGQQNREFSQQIGGGDFGGGISPNGGSGKRRGSGIGGKAGNNLLALNLGTALSQIFGNFTIEHDAKLVERKPEPTELQQFAEGMPPPPLDMAGTKRGNEASSEPHRLTRFFERPQRPLHGN